MKGQPGKAPAFMFYIKDWLCDFDLRLTSASTRGIWIDILCFMWQHNRRGEISVDKDELMQLTGANIDEVEKFFSEAKKYPFCRVILLHNGKITIRNRRMYKEFEAREKLRESNRLRQQKHREKLKSNKMSQAQKWGAPSPNPIPYPNPTTKKGKNAPKKNMTNSRQKQLNNAIESERWLNGKN